jgi:hypothetical protein
MAELQILMAEAADLEAEEEEVLAQAVRDQELLDRVMMVAEVRLQLVAVEAEALVKQVKMAETLEQAVLVVKVEMV